MTSRTCVITVNYKGADDTATCVASLMQSTVPVSIVVVDNTPDDPFLEQSLVDYTGVKLIKAPENLGFGRGNNLGIEWVLENTDCEFILILNNDATIEQDAIEKMEMAMDDHSEAGIVAARIVLAEDHSKLWYGGGEVDWRRGGGSVPGAMGASDAPFAMQARYVSFASGCSMMIRANILRQLGGFDDRFFMYEEDLEISLRIQESGWKIWYQPYSVINHIGQGSQRETGEFVGRYDAKNKNLAFLVYHGVKNSLLNAHLHAKGWNKVIFNVVFPMIIIKRGIGWALKGRIDALNSLVKAVRNYMDEK